MRGRFTMGKRAETKAEVDLRQPGAVLLVSCYELGRPPQALAMPLAFLERAGYRPAALDLSVEALDPPKIRQARFIGISVPMHTALRLGVHTARRIREINPTCHIAFYGHHALLCSKALLAGPADSVLGGELEADLVAQVERIGARVESSAEKWPAARLERLDFPVPSRDLLPSTDRYAHLVHQGSHVVAGQVQASRGCLHHCGHCPIPAVYGGRVFVVPVDVVLQDIRNQVEAGAQHISFDDADFLNGPAHVMRIVRRMHAEFPDLTFDFTAKIEHVLRDRRLMPELAGLGALFMVSAVESLNDRVLGILRKGHTQVDVYEALEVLREAGIVMRPSLLPFTPWSTRADFENLLRFAREQDLIECIDPVQYTIRLLLPPGTLLLEHPEMKAHLGPFDEEALSYRWSHPDPFMDTLQAELTALVENAVSQGEDSAATFARIHDFVAMKRSPVVVGESEPRLATPPAQTPSCRHAQPPRLTEPWFC